MALYSIDSGGQIREVTYTPHQAEFSVCRSRLTSAQIDAIHAELRDMIDGDEIHTAGWMPGHDWTDTSLGTHLHRRVPIRHRGVGILLRSLCLGGGAGTSRRMVFWKVREGRHSDPKPHLLSHSRPPRMSIKGRLNRCPAQTRSLIGTPARKENLMARANRLKPFSSLPPQHENRLTWAFLVALKYDPLLQNLLRELVESKLPPEAREHRNFWEPTRVLTQTKEIDPSTSRLVSILLTDEAIQDVRVR